MDLVLAQIIISAIGQVLFVFFRTKTLNHPVFFFNIAFFLHNWSDLFVTYLTGEEVGVLIPTDIIDRSIVTVAEFNLVAMWAFFIGACVLCRRDIAPRRIVHYKFDRFFGVYLFLSVCYAVYMFSSGQVGASYGANQALTSSDAFSPIGTLLNARIILGATYIIQKNKAGTKTIIIILTELLFSMLLGGRKAFLIVVFAFLLPKVDKITFKTLFIALIALPLISFAVLFLNVFRSLSGLNISFVDKIWLVSGIIMDNMEDLSLLLFMQLASASSEGVQCWTYMLIEEGRLPLMHGRTYLQAVINMFILRPFQGQVADWQAAYVFKSVAYPGVENMGYDFSFMSEALLNFGTSFYWIPYLFLGYFTKSVENRGQYNSAYMVFYYLIWCVLFITFRTDSTSTFRYFSYFIFFWFIMNKLTIKLNR